MVEVTVENDKLVFDVRGLDRVLAFRGRLEVPLQHVTGVRVDPEAAREWRKVKVIGTNVPSVVTAGTFWQHHRRVFWDVHDADDVVVVGLEHESYDELIVEVADPEATVARIREALAARA